MDTNQTFDRGQVSWCTFKGSFLGYITNDKGSDIYFDKHSLVESNCERIAIGDEVVFITDKNEFGEMYAKQLKKVSNAKLHDPIK